MNPRCRHAMGPTGPTTYITDEEHTLSIASMDPTGRTREVFETTPRLLWHFLGLDGCLDLLTTEDITDKERCKLRQALGIGIKDVVGL